MSRYQSETDLSDLEPPSACAKCWSFTWRTITCLFSHIALVAMVVAYCALGAFTFEALEVEHEKDVKRNISGIRRNVTNYLWKLALDLPVLDEDKYIGTASVLLQNFEGALVKAMTKDGWDGEEDEKNVQWTRTGSLFYSIIVITTIGYGHISPKTTLGKIVTIFYAILGIPLMLLCLSNIGDIMATSFRFLYWRVCCYACTRPKKPRRSRSVRSSARSSERFSRSRNASFRRSIRVSTRSADSGFAFSEVVPSTFHSDTELRYHDETNHNPSGSNTIPRNRISQTSRFSDSTVHQKKINSIPPRRPIQNQRGGSLDRKKVQKQSQVELDPMLLAKSSILCNKYVVDNNELLPNSIPGITVREMEGQQRTSPLERRAMSMPRSSNYLAPPRYPSPASSERDDESVRSSRPRRRKSPMPRNPSPKMMTPLGYGHKSKYLDDPESDEEYYDDDVYYDPGKRRSRPVPIYLCLLLVVGYIGGGAFLFKSWEKWDLLDAAYFCFITLTTIGFGDLVPAKGVTKDSDETTTTVTISIALCSLYLLFGISLLAMSFSLVQEEVLNNVKSVAKRLGIIKSEEEETSDDEL